MERKTVAGTIRNKARSREKLLEAVGKILTTEGYASLGVNHIAEVAGVDKKMIYTHFGSLDGLLDEYLSEQDFWSNVKSDEAPIEIKDGGKALAQAALAAQFDYVKTNVQFQKILLWRLSEQRDALKKLTERQEANGELLLQGISDPYFGENAEQYRAIMAVLVAGTYYLNLYAELNGSIFCGIDLSTTGGRDKIKDALSFLIDQTYTGLK